MEDNDLINKKDEKKRRRPGASKFTGEQINQQIYTLVGKFWCRVGGKMTFQINVQALMKKLGGKLL